MEKYIVLGKQLDDHKKIPFYYDLRHVIFGKVDEFIRSGKNPVIVIDGITGKEYRLRDIESASKGVAKYLQKSGIGINDVVCVSSENRWEYFAIFLACIQIGAIASPLNPVYTQDELNHALHISAPTAFVFSSLVADKVLSALRENNMKQKCYICFDKGVKGNETLKIAFFPDLMDTHYTLTSPSINPLTQTAAILYSSGTTGLPKGVMLTHRNIILFLNYLRDSPHTFISQTTVLLGLVPFFHGYGFGLVLSTLLIMSSLVILPKFEEKLFLSSIEKYKVNTLPLVPTVLHFLAKSPRVLDYDLTSIKKIICGAAPSSEEVFDVVKKRFGLPGIYHAYGMTETSILATLCPPDIKRNNSVGFLISDMACKIIDIDSKKPLPIGERGEVCLKGGYIMTGYYNNKQATDETIDSEGWLHTGDVGYLDEDHYLYIVDRIKELIKYKSYQVAPAELESALISHPGVTDAAVIGKPHEIDGEHPIAFIVKNSAMKLTSDDIILFIKGRFSPQKWLRGGVIFTKEIPKNPSGKILRNKLKEMLNLQSKL